MTDPIPATPDREALVERVALAMEALERDDVGVIAIRLLAAAAVDAVRPIITADAFERAAQIVDPAEEPRVEMALRELGERREYNIRVSLRKRLATAIRALQP